MRHWSLAIGVVLPCMAVAGCFGSSEDAAGAPGVDGGETERCPSGSARCVADGDAAADASTHDDDTLVAMGSRADAGDAGGTGAAHNSTWSDDGWNDRTPELLPIVWPEPRMGHTLAYDAARSRVVMFGGGNAGDRFDDVWERDATGAWTKPEPGAGRVPVPRYLHAMTYDSARSRTIVFGGSGIVARIGDLWDYDGTAATWTERDIAQGANWPLPHDGHTLSFEPALDTSVLFGGCCAGSGGMSNEVWEWTGTGGSWSNVTPSPLPETWPKGRRYHAMARDTDRGVLLLFGGAEIVAGKSDNEPFDDLWEYDPSAREWTNLTPESRPTDWPAARFMHAMAYDAARGTLVLFGGTAGGAPGEPFAALGDLWEYDAADARWTELTPADTKNFPAPRWSHAMAYDEEREAVVLFGGVTDGAFGQENMRDTWEYRP